MLNVIRADTAEVAHREAPAAHKPIVAKSAGVKRNRSGRITRDKILDAAEAAFARKGVHGASLREIMLAARVNIASINYYFGNKDDLLRAVVQRRAGAINADRLARLAAAVRAGNGTPAIEDWLRAYIMPLIEVESADDPAWRNFMRVLNWMTTARDDTCRAIEQEIYDDVRRAFTDALRAVLPAASSEEVHWRYHCVVAITRWCMTARDRVARATGSVAAPGDLDSMIAQIVPFLVGGLSAPLAHALDGRTASS